MIKRADPIDLERETGAEALGKAYAFLQKVVGVIAMALPVVVALGDWALDGHALRSSISAYYYGRTGNYFVGSLCALGVFFLSYEYRPRPNRTIDYWLSNVAFLMAIGAALFPTPSGGRVASGGEKWVGFLHLLCAGTLFGLLAIFSLYQFTKTAGEVTPEMSLGERVSRFFRTKPADYRRMSQRKQRRNKIYRTTGWIIVTCMALIGLSNALHWRLVFWLESIAVCAFGFAWLVKGELFSFLNDEGTAKAS